MLNDSILDFLADLGAMVPKTFNPSPDLDDANIASIPSDAVQRFASDTIMNTSVAASPPKKEKPYNKVSASDKGDPLPCTEAPFPIKDSSPSVQVAFIQEM